LILSDRVATVGRNLLIKPFQGENEEATSSLEDSPDHEKVTGDLKVGISIRNLTKVYSQVIKSLPSLRRLEYSLQLFRFLHLSLIEEKQWTI